MYAFHLLMSGALCYSCMRPLSYCQQYGCDPR